MKKTGEKWATYNTFLSALLLSVIAFGWISLPFLNTELSANAGSSAVSSGKAEISGRNFLLIGGGSEGIALALIRADTQKNMFCLTLLPPEWKTEYKGRSATLREQYAYGGPAYLKQCVAETIAPVDAYVQIGTDSLSEIIDRYGGLPVTLQEEVKGEGETFPTGDQVLDGKAALQLLGTDDWPGGKTEKRRAQAQAIGNFVTEYGTKWNVEAAYRAFPLLIDLVRTDLSLADREELYRLFSRLTEEGRVKCAVYPVPGREEEENGRLCFLPDMQAETILQMYGGSLP